MVAIVQTDNSQGRTPPPSFFTAGSSTCEQVSYTFPVGCGAGDIIELPILLAETTASSLRIVVTGTAVVGAVALLSGVVGDTVNARVMDANAFWVAGTATDYAVTLPTSEYDRSIGITMTNAVAAGAGTVTAILHYH